MRGIRSKASPRKKAFANYLRKNQTKPERDLGRELNRVFPETPIYRQSVAFGYILDFYVVANKETAPYKGLAIEVDGPHHLLRIAYDNKRDRVLLSKGIKTLRFSLGAINNNMAAVLAIIANEIKKIRK